MEAAVELRGRVTQAFTAASAPDLAESLLDVDRPVLHSKQYRITEFLGEGGMGKVYRAYDPMLERDVALKVLQPGLPALARHRFRWEARHGARLCHPNIVRVFDLGVLPSSGLDWFAMEYLVGRDLETLLTRAARRSLRLPARLIGLVFDRTLDALHHAHLSGLVHRDVKPANIFVTRIPGSAEVGIKLLDFGVAIDLQREGETAEVCGDPRYVAPEQAMGDVCLDHRADVYAAGISLFEAVTGRHPFEDEGLSSATSLIGAHCHRPVPAASAFLPDAWALEARAAIDVVIGKACAKDPLDRFESAAAMRAALRTVLAPAMASGAAV
jgi:serine/threonine-protein kinase